MTTIQWTHRGDDVGRTWNPIAAFDRETGKRGWFCTKVSEGCANCYAAGMNQWVGNGHDYRVPDLAKVEFRLMEEGGQALTAPLRWRKPSTVFVCSMTDIAGEWVPDEWLDRIFAVMALTPQHTYQVLTKRTDRLAAYFSRKILRVPEVWLTGAARLLGLPEVPGVRPWPLPNVWIMTSAENQERYLERMEHLARIPAVVRGISAEPLLGPIDFGLLGTAPKSWGGGYRLVADVLHWIIPGGESGTSARPHDVAWTESIVEQGREAGVAVFVKQLGSNACSAAPRSGKLRRIAFEDPKGGDPSEWPEHLRVRQFPGEGDG